MRQYRYRALYRGIWKWQPYWTVFYIGHFPKGPWHRMFIGPFEIRRFPRD